MEQRYLCYGHDNSRLKAEQSTEKEQPTTITEHKNEQKSKQTNTPLQRLPETLTVRSVVFTASTAVSAARPSLPLPVEPMLMCVIVLLETNELRICAAPCCSGLCSRINTRSLTVAAAVAVAVVVIAVVGVVVCPICICFDSDPLLVCVLVCVLSAGARLCVSPSPSSEAGLSSAFASDTGFACVCVFAAADIVVVDVVVVRACEAGIEPTGQTACGCVCLCECV